MSSNNTYKAIILSVFFSLLINIFFGRLLTAKISTLPLLNRWKLLSPQAPIVINTRQEVRVTDSGDIQKNINDSRSKISAVLVKNGSQTSLLGGAINLTSNGLLLTTKQVVGGNKVANLFVKLDDGSVSTVQTASSDPATDLVVLKTNFTGAPVANIAASDNLSAGQRVMLLGQGLLNNSILFQDSFIASNQQNDPAVMQDSDLPRRTFTIQTQSPVLAGQSVINQNSEIIGLWSGAAVISGDIIKDFIAKFLPGQSQALRPSFGFRYSLANPVDLKVADLPFGAKVAAVTPAGPAAKAGLLAGDIITGVNSGLLSQDNPLEKLLQDFQPGDAVQLTVQRGKDSLNLSLVATELK